MDVLPGTVFCVGDLLIYSFMDRLIDYFQLVHMWALLMHETVIVDSRRDHFDGPGDQLGVTGPQGSLLVSKSVIC